MNLRILVTTVLFAVASGATGAVPLWPKLYPIGSRKVNAENDIHGEFFALLVTSKPELSTAPFVPCQSTDLDYSSI